MLMPAAVLVVLVLAAITVDSSIAYLGEREVAGAAAAAANDAAGAALDQAEYRRSGTVRIDCAEAARVAAASFEARGPDWLRARSIRVVTCGGDRLTVEATAEVGLVFSPAVPGGPNQVQVSADAEAVAIRGEP
jgi:hypothetical protein